MALVRDDKGRIVANAYSKPKGDGGSSKGSSKAGIALVIALLLVAALFVIWWLFVRRPTARVTASGLNALTLSNTHNMQGGAVESLTVDTQETGKQYTGDWGKGWAYTIDVVGPNKLTLALRSDTGGRYQYFIDTTALQVGDVINSPSNLAKHEQKY